MEAKKAAPPPKMKHPVIEEKKAELLENAIQEATIDRDTPLVGMGISSSLQGSASRMTGSLTAVKDSAAGSVNYLKDQASAENVQALAIAQAEKLLTEEQRAYVDKIRRFRDNPLEAAVQEVAPFVPEDKQSEFETLKDIALNPDKYKNDPRARQFQSDPVLAFLNESENLVDDEHKPKIQITKILVDKEKGLDEKLEVMVPPEHIEGFRNYISVLKTAREQALELKRKKDELQI